MKFSEIKYQRPDARELLNLLDGITDQFKAAKSARDQYDLLLEKDRLMEEYYTMGSLVYIHYTLNTEDEFYRKEMQVSNETGPLIQAAVKQFEIALDESQFRQELQELTGEYLFIRNMYSLNSFSEDITQFVQEEGNLSAQYQGVLGASKITFCGCEYSISEMTKFVQDNDREVRKKAYQALGEHFESIHEEFDCIYDRLVKNRTEQAKKLGLQSYVELAYLRHARCFSMEEARRFRQLALRDVLPVVIRLKEEQAKRIGVDRLTYYDIGFRFADGNPIPVGTAKDTLAAGKQMYQEMSQETAEFIKVLYDGGFLDVLARPGKTAGGYCTSLNSYKAPFIFANFNRTAGDVDVLTHEAGHAYAFYTSARTIELAELQNPTAEACEVHSMSMEFFAEPWYPLFFGEQTEKYRLAHLEGTLDLILKGCQADHFQEEVYLNPGMSKEQRNDCWLRLEHLYRPYLDTEGIQFFERGADWQRQHHFFTHPYYFIDYSMAQAVALQFWVEMKKDWEHAWIAYNNFVKLGGKKSFFDLVKAVGLSVPTEETCLKNITEYVAKVLDRINRNE